MILMEGKALSGAELAEAIQSGASSPTLATVTGMVRASEMEGHVQFAQGGCSTWIELPVELIESATQVGERPCTNGINPVYVITLYDSEDPVAAVLSQLLAKASSPSAVGGATQSSAQYQPHPHLSQPGSTPTQAFRQESRLGPDAYPRFSPPAASSMQRAAPWHMPGGGAYGGGAFNQFGCWFKCCDEWTQCCIPTPYGTDCWTCCAREVDCCLW